MDPAEYARMYQLEDTYWWFQGRKRIVSRLLELLPEYSHDHTSILDLGCGTGLMLAEINRGHEAVGLDFSPLALDYSRRRSARRLIRADVQRLPIKDKSFDIALALDLAEHVERDDLFFAETLRILKPGGHFVISVPAHPFLWSDHDEALYHFRRYTLDAFRSRLREAGFEIERLTYCITFTFPIIVGFRFLQRLLKRSDAPKSHVIVPPRWANSLLEYSVAVEAFLLKYVNLPFGVTLLAVAGKRR